MKYVGTLVTPLVHGRKMQITTNGRNNVTWECTVQFEQLGMMPSGEVLHTTAQLVTPLSHCQVLSIPHVLYCNCD